MLPPVPTVPSLPEDLPPLPGGTAARLREDLAFAEALAEEGECWRAATEYKRIAFLGNRPALRYWSQMRIGWCHLRQGDFEESRSEFLRAALLSGTPRERNDALFLAGASFFGEGDYPRCEDALLQMAPEPDNSKAAEIRELLRGMTSMAVGEWNAGAERISAVSQSTTDPIVRRNSLLLGQAARNGRHLSRRNPAVAATMSALLPGSGQIYSNRTRDGVRHFLFNGLLVYWLVRLIDEENYAGAFLIAGVELPFYLGNVLGAKKSAERFNRSRRWEHLDRASRTTES
jgi:hypothetical protein